MRYKLTLEYDGTNYSGWQKQKNAKTIQGTLMETFARVLNASGGKLVDIQGSGRTDAGVHALGQVAHMEAETSLSNQALLEQINQELPPSINLLKLEQTDERFHARHWATTRQYVYRISRRRNVFEKKYVLWVKEDLNLDAMRQAARPLPGMHDFASFSSKPAKEKSTQVLLESLELLEEGDLILVRVRASHFLWNMMRNLVGTLVEIGKGKLPVAYLAQALESYHAELTQHRAPASGLFLEKVEYKEN